MSNGWSGGCGIIGRSEHALAPRTPALPPPRPVGCSKACEERPLFLIRISNSSSGGPQIKTADTRLYSRDRFARVAHQRVPQKNGGRRECRVHAAPAASRANEKSTRASHHRYAETVRHSLRDGATAYFVLSPVTGLFCHRRFADNPAKLDTSVGVSGPHDFAVRHGFIRRLKPPRPSHPAPRFVTIAKRPLCERETAELVNLICPTAQRRRPATQ
jgi:hypothetical protein